MKTNFPPSLAPALRIIAGFALGAASAVAAPLAATTAVHTQPDTGSPAVSVLKAGTEPVPSENPLVSAPAGWLAVDLAGPFEGYVENKDLTKSLDVKPGTPIRLAPNATAAVLTLAEKDDPIEITGIRGRWTQISLKRKLIGYVHVGGATATPPSTGTSSAAPAAPAPMSPAPVAPGAYGVAPAGQPAPSVNLGDGGASALPRQFAGRFVSTRRPLTPRRPYDYALNDEAGKRYAYLDISKLLLTEQIEKYINHHVVVFGAAKNSPDSKDIVIQVETLQLRQ